MSHSHCVCGKTFSVQHCLSTPTGGFPVIRHNEVRDITAEKFIEVCPNVEEQLSGELLAFRMSISCDEERLDISANAVWGGNLRCKSVQSTSGTLPSVYRKHEVEKKRCYDQRIREVEHSSFSNLDLSCTGGMGKLATIFYKRLALVISEKKEITLYSQVLWWI